jgi:hypothetical protein
MLCNYLKALRKQVLIFIVAIAVAAFVIVASKQYWHSVVAENTQAEQRLQQAKQKHRQAIDRKSTLKEYSERYAKLEKANIVGNENRIDWINLLEIIAKDKKIPYINYKIDKQVALNDKAVSRKFPGMNIYKSVMTLNMRLLHEGDLYTVINELKLNAQGMFDVSFCEIKRMKVSSGSILNTGTGSNFSADCKLNWYTFQPKSG